MNILKIWEIKIIIIIVLVKEMYNLIFLESLVIYGIIV